MMERKRWSIVSYVGNCMGDSACVCGQLFFFKSCLDKLKSSLILKYSFFCCFFYVFKNQSLGEHCAHPSSSAEAEAQSTCGNEVMESEINNLRKGLVGFYSLLSQLIKKEKKKKKKHTHDESDVASGVNYVLLHLQVWFKSILTPETNFMRFRGPRRLLPFFTSKHLEWVRTRRPPKGKPLGPHMIGWKICGTPGYPRGD